MAGSASGAGASGAGLGAQASALAKRPRDDASSAESDGVAMATLPIKAARASDAPPISFKIWHYDGDAKNLFCFGHKDGEKVAWCRLCKAGPLTLGNGGMQNLLKHLNTQKHTSVPSFLRVHLHSRTQRMGALTALTSIAGGTMRAPCAVRTCSARRRCSRTSRRRRS